MEVIRTSVSLPENLLFLARRLQRDGNYKSFSHLVREALRLKLDQAYIKEEEAKIPVEKEIEIQAGRGKSYVLVLKHKDGVVNEG